MSAIDGVALEIGREFHPIQQIQRNSKSLLTIYIC